MNTKGVYKKYDIPQNLQDHMLSVALLVQLIQLNWEGSDVNWPNVLEAALLHDIGNIVKFDLEKYPELLGAELPRIEYWKAKQQEMIKKYGDDDHRATDKILNELKANQDVRNIIQTKSFGNAKDTALSDELEPKILLYCDLRVLPGRIGNLNERIEDVSARLNKYSERPDFEELVAACHQIEDTIKGSYGGNLESDIQKLKLDEIKHQLLETQIVT